MTPLLTLGVFDSGVGGLSVLRYIHAWLPQANLIYFADQAHVPYGRRPAEQIQQFSVAISRFLLAAEARLIVVACNTASAAALVHLRATLPDVPFVGMEPAVKPGAQATHSGKVGVLATARTFDSQRYSDLMAQYAQHVTLYQDPCTGLVPLIEAGEFAAGPTMTQTRTYALLQSILTPMLAAGVDTLVLGCTHYPFVLPLIRHIAGPDVALIDPAPAVARQTLRLVQQQGWRFSPQAEGEVLAYTSGDPARLAGQIEQLLGYRVATRPAPADLFDQLV